MEEHLKIIEDSLKQTESQEEALKIVLSLSTDAESLTLFSSSKAILQLLIDLSTEDRTANTALQILINFSQNEDLSSMMVKTGIFNVLFEYLKTHLKPDQADEKAEIGYVATENMYEVRSATKSNIPLVLMLISNLTTYTFGRVKFLNASENPALKTFMLENIIGMTTFFKDSEFFNFGANIITNCTIDALKVHADAKAPLCTLQVFTPLFDMMTSIKKSPVKRLKITEGVKNLMFNHSTHLKELKESDVLSSLGKALIEANHSELPEVMEEDCKLKDTWMEAYEKRNDTPADIGAYKDSFNHCLMDSLVLLANEEDMLLQMHEYGIQNLFEILNFQKYVKDDSATSVTMYQSFMGDAKISEKATIILNQIIAVLQGGASENEVVTNEQEDAKES